MGGYGWRYRLWRRFVGGGTCVPLNSTTVSSAVGDITIRGTAGASGNNGVEFERSLVTTEGNLLVEGTSAGDDGIDLESGEISTTGTGTLTITGTSTALASGDGVEIEFATGVALPLATSLLVTSENGALIITGTGSGAGDNDQGVA